LVEGQKRAVARRVGLSVVGAESVSQLSLHQSTRAQGQCH
jgi:hypothetical protein